MERFVADKLLSNCTVVLYTDFVLYQPRDFYLGQSYEPRRKNEQIGSVVCSILAVPEKVCVRWSWQDNLTELNLMFENVARSVFGLSVNTR